MENIKGLTCNSGESKIVHIHPSLQCNLFCKHCYSESSPQLKSSLDLNKLKPFLAFARGEGYNIVSISGGEPFLYRDLEELTAYTKSVGFYNMVVSNGMLLGSEKNKRILQNIDLIAISIDGNKELHDDMRQQNGAFEKMISGVNVLKELGKTFGFIHTITERSWKQLLWIAEFAHGNGARLFQLHPLENFGRARQSFNYSLSQEILYKAYILYHYIKDKYNDAMFVQLDFLHKQHIIDFPSLVNVHFDGEELQEAKQLRNLINTIIIDEKGNILPIAYGFSKEFMLENIYRFNTREEWIEADVFEKFLNNKSGTLYRKYKTAYNYVVNSDNEMINWNELIVEMSNEKTMELV